MQQEWNITDLIDADILQQLQNSFSKLTGIASLTTDANGVAVTEGTNFSEFCMKYTRKSTLGRLRCEQCDKYGAETALKKGAATIYYCHAGLTDLAAPIMAGDKMIGCFIGGQVLTEPPNMARIMETAREINVDPMTYWNAATNIRILPKESLQTTADFLYTIANVLSNIAHHKLLVNQANMEAEKAARMKSDFLANMSHEIRTPMNAVIGMAEMALREDLPPAAREHVNQIKSSGKTLLTIINDILDFSKIESGKLDIVSSEYEMFSIINDITNIIMTRIDSKDVEFVLDIAPDIPSKLHGDLIRIKQLIINIANNAVKFTEHGQVLLKIDFIRKHNHQIDLLVSVTDTGIGIKKEDFGNLFQSFQQVDSKRNRNVEGTGLGLAISKQLLALMHGNIWAESEYGKGSRFSFIVPQRVDNMNPSVDVKALKPFTAFVYVSNPYVKKQLETDIKRFGGTYHPLSSPKDLPGLEPDDNTFFFIEHCVFTEQMAGYIQGHPEITGVLMLDFRSSYTSDIDNLLVIKKPLYTLNIASILNHEDIHMYLAHPSDDDFEFIAPDAEILIVDDNTVNLTVTEGLLEPMQMHIDTALSGKIALDKIAEKHYDLIFMDHMMPELDGVETTHIIRRFHEDYDDVPIIALTANAVSGTRAMFLREGLDDFVPKPIELRFLISTLKHWLPKEKILKVSQHTKTQQKPEPKPTLKIEGLDVDAALKLLGSEKLYWSVLKDYYHLISKKVQLIRTLEQNGDWRGYTIEVHALKSASRQIGATTLSDMAAALEQAGNAEDSAMIHEQTPGLLEKYSEYSRILAQYFPDEVSHDEGKQEADSSVLQELFQKLREALDNLDMDEMEAVLQDMDQYRYVDWQHDLFERLRTAIDDIDVDACEDIMKEWEEHNQSG